jgi:aspartyl-tRNA(Asn)/glutamyl-tRNA(Gln) amidotransferase subunit C
MAEKNLDIHYVAELARIALSDEEEVRLGKQLEGILGYVRQLETLDLEDIEPTAHATPIHSVLRPDEAHPENSLSREAALTNAPRESGGQFIVPKVLE